MGSSLLASRSRPIAVELHGLLRDLDPARFRGELETAARRRIAEIAEAIERMMQGPVDDPNISSALVDLAQVLDEKVPESEAGGAEAWTSFRKQLSLAYESLKAQEPPEDKQQ